ncbi:MAG: hypothetical protein RL616_934 [Verrucomicrobiota bacterium]|jgi:protein-arginine kinase activator protein McsA
MKMKYVLIAAIAAIALLPSLALAQEKGATKLLKLQTPENLQQVEVGDTILMTCPKCQDTFASIVTKPMKGVESDEMKTMMKHMCPTCSTSIRTDGIGKNATDKLVHTCNACGSTEVSCCLMKKNGGKTEGM